MIKAVFFDAINTLFLPNPTSEEMYQRIIFETTGKNIELSRVREILNTCDKAINDRDLNYNTEKHGFWDEYPVMIAKMVGCSEEDCQTLGGKIRFESWGNPNNYFISPDTIETLERILEKDVRIACVSNEDGWLGDFFDHFGLTEYFEYILASESVGIEKPNPRIFEIALKEMGLRPNEVIFVGDSPVSDYFGATNVGMKALLIDRENKLLDDKVAKINQLSEVLEYI